MKEIRKKQKKKVRKEGKVARKERRKEGRTAENLKPIKSFSQKQTQTEHAQ